MSIYAWSAISLVALIVAALCFARTIIDRRREQARELTAQQLLDVIVDNSSDAIIHESLAGTILGWNMGAARMFGQPAASALGRRLSAVVPPDSIWGEDVIVASLSAGIRLRDFETQITREDGRTIHALVTVSPIRNQVGEAIGALRTIRDITEQKLAY